MLLSARLLDGVLDVNHFETVAVVEFYQGTGPDIYLQLVNKGADQENVPPGRRYVPAANSALEVTITNVDPALTVVADATQPFAEDGSIWKVANDPQNEVDLTALLGTYSLKLKLTEGTKVTYGFVNMALNVKSSSPEF